MKSGDTIEATRQTALDQLYAVFSDSCSHNWDGHGAVAIGYGTYQAAKRFIEMLPDDVPMPEAAPEPDGEISLEWFGAPERVFSVSVNAHHDLHYAGLFGRGRTHGTETFFDTVPPFVLNGIRRVGAA